LILSSGKGIERCYSQSTNFTNQLAEGGSNIGCRSAPVGNTEPPDRRKIEQHRSIKLYQYKLDQYELVCYNLG